MKTCASVLLLSTCLLLAAATSALAQTGAQPSRGQLLYETHCIACHNTQMHWRDKRSATDWKSLLAQVRVWQQSAKLRWSDKDIIEVARYLNELVYHYPVTNVAGSD